MKKKKAPADPSDVATRDPYPAPEPPAAYDAAEEKPPRPLTIRVRGMSGTKPIKTMEPGGGEKETRYGYWRGRIPGDEVPEWARSLPYDENAVPDFVPRNPGAFYWPPDSQAEYDVTLEQLEEIKADKNVVISYDPAEEQMLRARLAPTVAAREAALRAAKMEAELAETKARVAMLTAQAAAAEAEKIAAEAKARLANEEARIRAGG